jgi:multiple sugar transport system ATP-binding protein
MNFIPFRGRLAKGATSVRVGEAEIEVPEVREESAETDLVLGARPEHVRLASSSRLRATVVDAEYLGTNQIVTLTTADGARVKARISSEVQVRPGEVTGLALRREKLSVFDRASGRALRSALHEGVARG